MAATPVGDAVITRQVQGKLSGRGLGPPCRINVTTLKGVVTLSGTVQQESQKGLAHSVARGIGGVTNIINQLSVKAREHY